MIPQCQLIKEMTPMTTLIELPDKQTALFRDGNELSNRDVKILRRAARKVGLVSAKLKELGMDDVREDAKDDDSEDTDAAEKNNQRALSILTKLSDDEDDDLDLFQRVCVAVRLIEWSLDLPLPRDADAVDDLPRPIYAVLTAEAAKLDLRDNYSKEAGLADPKADTENSDSSEQPLAEVSS